MLRRIISCSKHFRKDSGLLVRIAKRNEDLQPSRARNPWTEGKKICCREIIFRGAAGKSEHVTEWRTITQETVKNFFRGTGRSNNITAIVLLRYFATVLNLAFLSVITGRLCCLITNQCCQFWSFNVRSVVLREICEVWCIADKFHLDWAQLFLFSTFPLLLRCHEVIFVFLSLFQQSLNHACVWKLVQTEEAPFAVLRITFLLYAWPTSPFNDTCSVSILMRFVALYKVLLIEVRLPDVLER